MLKRMESMKRKLIVLTILLLSIGLGCFAQSVSPKAYYTDKEGNAMESTSIDDGEAPLEVSFRANPADLGEWTASYEWHFKLVKGSDSRTPGELFVRYEENTNYTFNESGTYNIILKTHLTNGDDTDMLEDQTITITIAESKLEFPNAFSPNGDGINDIYRAKKDYKSIVSFRAIILNRWGQKLYEWDSPDGGWDGKYNGNDVKQGVYFVFVEAKGADGKEYKIRKDVNLLRGYTDTKNTTGEQ